MPNLTSCTKHPFCNPTEDYHITVHKKRQRNPSRTIEFIYLPSYQISQHLKAWYYVAQPPKQQAPKKVYSLYKVHVQAYSQDNHPTHQHE
jgi:hypothetical protein